MGITKFVFWNYFCLPSVRPKIAKYRRFLNFLFSDNFLIIKRLYSIFWNDSHNNYNVGTFWIFDKCWPVMRYCKNKNLSKKFAILFWKKSPDFEKVHLLKFVQKSVLKISRFCFLQKFIESIPKQLWKNQILFLLLCIFKKCQNWTFFWAKMYTQPITVKWSDEIC